MEKNPAAERPGPTCQVVQELKTMLWALRWRPVSVKPDATCVFISAQPQCS